MLFKSKEVLKYFREWGPMVQNSIGNKVFCRSGSLFFYTKFKYTLQKSVFQCRNNNDTYGGGKVDAGVCLCGGEREVWAFEAQINIPRPQI